MESLHSQCSLEVFVTENDTGVGFIKHTLTSDYFLEDSQNICKRVDFLVYACLESNVSAKRFVMFELEQRV
jgi:hypothetical protein